MTQIVCNNCKEAFDEEGLIQCPHCDAAIGTIKVFKSVTQSDGTIIKKLIAERIGKRSSDGAADMLIAGEESCDIVFVERMSKAKYSASNPYPSALKNLIVLILSILSLSSYAQKKPTLMILPSDNWCIQHQFMIPYDNQGTLERIPNYRQAFQENAELKTVISKMGELMIKLGYSLKDAEMEIKNISTRTAEDNVTFSKSTGARILESPIDALKRKAKADIIIQIGWTIARVTGGRSLCFTIEAFDAYTSKRIATVNESYDASEQIVADAVQNAIKKQLKQFDKQIDDYFSAMKSKGRETLLIIRTWDNWENNLETEYDGNELIYHIQMWLAQNTVNGKYNLSDVSDDMAQFEQVMIPLKDKQGIDLDAQNFARGLQNYIKNKFNITSKLMMRGLGEAIIIMGEK